MNSVSQQQMALSIFEEMLASDTPITESPHDIGFNRNNVFVDVADLGLAARKAVDAAYFLVSQDPERRPAYDYDLTYFKWLMSYDSNNRKHLRGVLREAQKAAIQVNDIDINNPANDRWVSVPLLGPVGIAGGRIVFEVHPTLQAHLKDPRSFTYLSLRITASFSSLYARILYDRLSAIAYRGGTDWLDIGVVREWVGAQDSKTLTEFKYLKRDVLEPAVKQINEVSDITVRYETRSGQGTKRIAKIRFIVARKPDGATRRGAAMLPSVESQKLYVVLREEFGLAQSQFDEIMEHRDKWSDDWIWHAIEFTRHRLKQGKVTKSPAGFLMMAIRENLRLSLAEREISERSDSCAAALQRSELDRAAAEAQASEQVSSDILAGLAIFDALGVAEREQMVKEFARTPQAKLAATRGKLRTPLNVLTEADIRGSKALSRALGGFMALKRPAADSSLV